MSDISLHTNNYRAIKKGLREDFVRVEHSSQLLSTGSLIVNNKGIPGTLGCIAFSNDFGTPVFLTAYHVLFGKHAQQQENVWLVKYNGKQQRLYLVGKSLIGKIGIFQNGLQPAFIDCALGLFSDEVLKNPAFSEAGRHEKIQGTAEAIIGECVTKLGRVTNATKGIIASTSYNDVCNINGTIYQACNQILIKPADGEKFSTKGDSGSVVLNNKNEVVGLLWCVNHKDEGIACPIGPVMEQLNICFNADQIKEKVLH